VLNYQTAATGRYSRAYKAHGCASVGADCCLGHIFAPAIVAFTTTSMWLTYVQSISQVFSSKFAKPPRLTTINQGAIKSKTYDFVIQKLAIKTAWTKRLKILRQSNPS